MTLIFSFFVADSDLCNITACVILIEITFNIFILFPAQFQVAGKWQLCVRYVNGMRLGLEEVLFLNSFLMGEKYHGTSP